MTAPLPHKVEIVESVIYQTLNEEAVLLNLTTQDYYGLNSVGAEIWQLLVEDGEVDSVVRRMKLIYNMEEGKLRSDVTHLVGDLLGAGLLRPSTS